jgi:hypothetical protein
MAKTTDNMPRKSEKSRRKRRKDGEKTEFQGMHPAAGLAIPASSCILKELMLFFHLTY